MTQSIVQLPMRDPEGRSLWSRVKSWFRPVKPLFVRLGMRLQARNRISEFFPGSGSYWEQRYQQGRTSGAGSYGRLAEFKAEILNDFVAENGIKSVIEFGCGDGNQISLAKYPRYFGLDVSDTAISVCRERFKGDATKQFLQHNLSSFANNERSFNAELALSLDVIYHLVEDDVFECYMSYLFGAASRFVVVYSSNHEEKWWAPHVRHRKWSFWVASNHPEWLLKEKIPNRYPFDDQKSDTTSFSDFYVFERRAASE